MTSVFISYSSKDREIADFTGKELTNHAIDVFIDYQRLKGGQAFTETLGREIDKCDYFILMLSSNSAQSKWVKREMDYALFKEKTIIPVIVEQVHDMAAFFPIVGLHQVDFQRWNSDKNMSGPINQLLDALGITTAYVTKMAVKDIIRNDIYTVAPNEIGFATGRYTDQVSFNSVVNILGGTSLYKATEPQTSKVWARWTPTIKESDGYEIQVFVPQSHSNTKNARYKINHVNNVTGEIIVEIDQSKYTNEWVTLGEYELNKTIVGVGTIFLNDLTGENGCEIAFTAIRYRQLYWHG